MQGKFLGFDERRVAFHAEQNASTGVPDSFFTQLLPQVSNPNELKTILYFMFLAGQKQGDPKWVGYWELASSAELLNGLRRSGDPRPPIEQLRLALEMCLARGSLIRVEATPPPTDYFGEKGDLEPVTVTWFLLNTAANRDFMLRLERGEIKVEDTSLLFGVDIWDSPLTLPDAPPDEPASEELGTAALEIRRWQQRWKVQGTRHDIYTLYEQNIGPLTPILSEKLREAEKLYPAEWIRQAFAEAVNYNRRNWAYVARILEKWAIDGKERQTGRRDQPRTTSGRGQPGSRREYGEFRRTSLAGDGADGSGAKKPGDEANRTVSGRPATSGSQSRPIDFTKYTAGKYASAHEQD